MIIPFDQIAAETLDSILQEHVLREGTNYGEHEVAIDSQVAQLRKQLVTGDIVLVYSELHESVNLLPKSELNLT